MKVSGFEFRVSGFRVSGLSWQRFSFKLKTLNSKLKTSLNRYIINHILCSNCFT